VALGMAGVVLWASGMHGAVSKEPSLAQSSIPVGVLGDSDSHSYHDRIWVPPEERGGPYRAVTFQWTEALARLRGQDLDLGEWGIWGTRKLFVRMREGLGLQGRTPRKEDYRHSFALGGAGCSDLMTGDFRQAPRLAALMDQEPQRWRKGVVVIRIGVVDFGLDNSLDQLARSPAAPQVQAVIAECLRQIHAAVELIHQRHPQTRIVLVGIFDNAHWPRYAERWQSATELANIAAGLDAFDQPLRQLAASDPRIAFFDDRAWFAERWGGRDEAGKPAYRTVSVLPGLAVTHTAGDHPRNAVVEDGHAGVVWNTLWAQSLVSLMNTEFGLQIPPITDAELQQFLEPARTAEKSNMKEKLGWGF
jgi:hypothetical protein